MGNFNQYWHFYYLQYNSYLDSLNIAATEFLATTCLEKYHGDVERDFGILNCLNELQSIYNDARSKKLRALDNTMAKEFTRITNQFIDALRFYAVRLPLHTPSKYNPALEFKILSDEMAKSNNSNGTSLPPADEKLFYERQILAVVALFCTEFPQTTQSLLFEKCERVETTPNYMEDDANGDDDEMDGDNRVGSFIDILIDILSKIGHSVIRIFQYKSS